MKPKFLKPDPKPSTWRESEWEMKVFSSSDIPQENNGDFDLFMHIPIAFAERVEESL